MSTSKSLINSAEVREVRESFERWRSSRQRRERIPPKLWRMAAQLCETDSIHQIARRLRLNYTALKAQVVRRSRPLRRKITAATPPAFVEFAPAGIIPDHSSAEYVVEAPDPRKGTPRILVRHASALEVAALFRALRADGE